MPFTSKSQARWMFANKPGMAKEWASKTPSIKKLPNHVKKHKTTFGGIRANAQLPTMPTSTYRQAITHPFNPLAGSSKYEDPKGASIFNKKKHKLGHRDALRSGNYHQQAQRFINSAKAHGFKVRAEDTGELNAYYKRTKHKLGIKGKTKPGDLLRAFNGSKGSAMRVPKSSIKAFKKKTVSKGKWYGETDLDKKVIKVNKKFHKTNPLHKKQYPELLDTIKHETLHAEHPKMTEKEVYKRTHKAVKTMGNKEKSRLYSMFNK